MLIRVVLPLPEGPIIAMDSPAFMQRDMSFKTGIVFSLFGVSYDLEI
jgi:hypothetical protein